MKMNKLFKKYGLLFLLGILTLGVLITTIVVLSNSEDMKSYEGELFSVNYDSTWKVKSKKDGLLELVHRKSKSTLVIEETSLQDEYQYSVIDDLIDELSYSISDQNKSYKLLSKDKAKVGKDNSDGYKLLYEDDKSQILVIITKKGSKLRLFTYSAKYEYFDMVLDSAYNIIDSYESGVDDQYIYFSIDYAFFATTGPYFNQFIYRYLYGDDIDFSVSLQVSGCNYEGGIS